MKRIAVLGLGAMGQRMALRLFRADYEVVIWNRSGVPPALSLLGHCAKGSPKEAVESADAVIAMLRDDAASAAVWNDPSIGALGALRSGTLVIESSTLTPAWVARLGEQIQKTGAHFLDAPVVGTRPQAEAGTLVYLVGGPPEIVDRARPLLAVLGSTIHHLGPTPAGASAKLMVNALFGAQVALVAELLGFIRGTLLDVEKALSVMNSLPVISPAAAAALAAMRAERFEPMFPIDLVVKDLDYALAQGARVGAELPMVQQAEKVFEKARERGLGAANLTAVAKLYRL